MNNEPACAIDEAKCAQCGGVFQFRHLDAKPNSARFIRERATVGQLEALRNAGDRNEDFDRLECKTCYGPGYAEI